MITPSIKSALESVEKHRYQTERAFQRLSRFLFDADEALSRDDHEAAAHVLSQAAELEGQLLGHTRITDELRKALAPTLATPADDGNKG